MENREAEANPTAAGGQLCELVVPDVLTVVWTSTLGHEITLPHHYSPAEVAHFFAVLIETFGFYGHYSTIIF